MGRRCSGCAKALVTGTEYGIQQPYNRLVPSDIRDILSQHRLSAVGSLAVVKLVCLSTLFSQSCALAFSTESLRLDKTACILKRLGLLPVGRDGLQEVPT